MPVRTCIVCRGRFEKDRLLRWTVDADGAAVPDPKGTRPGRGGYVCRRPECLERLERREEPGNFRVHFDAFRLAVQGAVGQNGAVETHDK